MSIQFARFCVVGFIGFLVDYGALELLVQMGFTPAIARIISIALALQVTFLLHRSFTFRVNHAWKKAWAKFMVSNLLGALVNYCCFVLALQVMPRLPAIILATAIALWFNYWANRRFVFGGPR